MLTIEIWWVRVAIRLSEYLLSIYAQSFDYSFLIYKGKIKIQRYKEHKKPLG